MKRMVSLLLILFVWAGWTAAAWAQETDPTDRAAVGFSLRLFQEALRSGETNAVISPVSAYLTLAMAAMGAQGDTRAAFEATLGMDADAYAAHCAALSDTLRKTQGNTLIRIANSGWIDADFEVLPSYMDRLAGRAGAEIFVRDLDTDATREAVNLWVSDATGGLIPALLSENLKPETVLALINTLYFKADWLDPFESYNTQDLPFFRADGSDVDVPFLAEWSRTRSSIQAEGVEGVLRPYDDGKTAFLALRATDGRTAQALAESLTPDVLSAYLNAAKNTYMTLFMPKFTLEYELTMNDALKAMGLAQAFDAANADFSGMGKSPMGNLYLSRVL
ncbi:MAG TPA: serpin family protein, partial [Clostridia bacterium]|nr:serpin family protein [Clostridia bacterium]